MFTGLIAELGKITAIDMGADSAVITVLAAKLSSEIAVGDSIAVNGVCLTATKVGVGTFTADVMAQTLKMTSLKDIAVGTAVNLELAARPTDRLGGHVVQGHVDGVGTVVLRAPGQRWEQLDITVPEPLTRYIVNQGSITIDGISLTVGQINDATRVLTLWLIPETLERTNLATKSVGDIVNIEVDVLAKYVERLLEKKSTKGGPE